MVNRGKPSTGCETCRKRGKKCDETRPTCLQCQRLSLVCGGYRDPGVVMFRDMTETTAQKARRKKKKIPGDEPATTPETVESPSSTTSTELASFASPVPQSDLLNTSSTSIEASALNFWISGMLTSMTKAKEGVGQASLLPKLFASLPNESPAFFALRAVSMAAYSRFTGDQNGITLAAHDMYGTALKSLRKAIESPTARFQSSTLMSVMMMVSADSMLAIDEAPHRQWKAHIMALGSLLALRGRQGLYDPVAARLYLSTKSFIVEGAGRQLPPDTFFGMPQEEYPPPLLNYIHSAPYTLLQATVGVGFLREQTISMLNDPTIELSQSQISDIMKKLAEADRRALVWASSLDEEYDYVLVQAAPTSPHDGLQDSVQDLHLYKSAIVTRLWNGYRIARIFLNSLLLQCQSRLDDPFDEEARQDMTYLDNLQSLGNDVCRSIPVWLRPKEEAKRLSALGDTTETPNPIDAAVDAWSLLWPLYVAHGIVTLPDDQRKWLRACLIRITDVYRLRQGLQLVELADKEPGRPVFVSKWDDAMLENVFEASYSYGYGGR